MDGKDRAVKEPHFKDLNADSSASDVTEIESLCMNCHKNGITKLLLTKIPFYKEVIISSFCCDECGFSNSGLQSGAEIQTKGIKFKLKVKSTKDLNREVIKSDFSSVFIPEIDLEIPPNSQPGEITTIEGVINRVISGLSQNQHDRQNADQETAIKIASFITKLAEIKNASDPFNFILEDPSGNSFLENPCAPQKDPEMEITHFERTKDQEIMLGLQCPDNQEIGKAESDVDDEKSKPVNTDEEVFHFNTNCSQCNTPCQTKMKVTKIPNFKEVIIMATTCDSCGYRTNEVKSGSGIEPLGMKIELKVTESVDMARDVLKSDTCSIIIPEIDLDVGAGALGGKFTTVEGLLVNIKDQLSKENPFVFGDSANDGFNENMKKFFDKLEQIKACSLPVTLILDDPCGNSYLQNIHTPDEDPNLKVTNYERTFDQNEELGLNDMKTEKY